MTAPAAPLPTPKQQIIEIKAMFGRMVEKFLQFNVDYGPPTADLRRYCGDLLVRFDQYLFMNKLSVALLNCFRAATNANMTLNGFDDVINQLLSETPTDVIPKICQQTAIMFGLAEECRVIMFMTFDSRDDVDIAMDRMRKMFDKARDLAADEMASSAYESLTGLAASLSRYLADTARPLPRMVDYQVGPWPALTVANFIYGDGSRWEEIAKENHVVHPAFCPRELRALSN